MRTTHRCPKCSHAEVLHVPEPQDTDFDRLAIGGRPSWFGTSAHGALESYSCLRCGYTELYLREPQSIEVARIKGARVMRG